MEQYGFFSTSSSADTTTKKVKHIASSAKPARRRNGTSTTAKREYPPPLTTSLVRQTAAKRFNFVKRCADDGRRVVVEAEEMKTENLYCLKVRREDGRLIVALIPINELETNASISCDNHDDHDADHEIIHVSHDEDVDFDHDIGDHEVKEEEEERRFLGTDSPPKMAFPFFESVFEPASVRSISMM